MKKETIYLSLAMLAMATTPCNAQSEEIKDSTQHLEEVVISTTRMPEIKQNAAATVTILGQKQIAEMSKSAPDITHLLGMLTPGMALSSNTTSSRSQSLRGRSALILIDGIPQSTPLRSTDRDIRTIDIAAIDHIEVVKGSTALYGNGAIQRATIEYGMYKGNRVPYAPRYTATAGAKYQCAVGEGTLTTNVYGNFVSSQFSDIKNTEVGSANGNVGLIPKFFLLNATANYSYKQWIMDRKIQKHSKFGRY